MNKIKTPPNPDFRPLYVQVMEIISKRIEKGEWGPGEVLPAEPKFAEELGVSQGTVRKALDNIARKKNRCPSPGPWYVRGGAQSGYVTVPFFQNRGRSRKSCHAQSASENQQFQGNHAPPADAESAKRDPGLENRKGPNSQKKTGDQRIDRLAEEIVSRPRSTR